MLYISQVANFILPMLSVSLMSLIRYMVFLTLKVYGKRTHVSMFLAKTGVIYKQVHFSNLL